MSKNIERPSAEKGKKDNKINKLLKKVEHKLQ